MNHKNDIAILEKLNQGNQFNVNELVPLLYHEFIRKEDQHLLPKPPVLSIGIACGILTMNSEVELLIQFPQGIDQISKAELHEKYLIVEETD